MLDYSVTPSTPSAPHRELGSPTLPVATSPAYQPVLERFLLIRPLPLGDLLALIRVLIASNAVDAVVGPEPAAERPEDVLLSVLAGEARIARRALWRMVRDEWF